MGHPEAGWPCLPLLLALLPSAGTLGPTASTDVNWTRTFNDTELASSSQSPGALGALVAGGILLPLAIGGSVLAYRLRRPRANSRDLGRAGGSQDPPGPGTGPEATDTSSRSTPTPDYENVFLGQSAEDSPWPAPRNLSSGDSDCYMNYKGTDPDPQPVYCNLESLR